MPDAGPIAAGEVHRLTAGEADTLLERLDRTVPRHPTLVSLGREVADEAIVFGDSHGDWWSISELTARFLEDPGRRALVGLGDYIDRPPPDAPGGSVANALALLDLAGTFPERVLLIVGNHELARRLGAHPHTLPREVAALWGPDSGRYERLMELLERGPLLARTASGAYLAHAGFPRGPPTALADRPLDRNDPEFLLNVTWPEPDASDTRRGAALPWGREELERFLDGNGLSIFLRGHDPDLTGRPLYADRCLTLHSCRRYEQYGGVLAARVPLRAHVRSVRDVTVEHLDSEGRRFDSSSAHAA